VTSGASRPESGEDVVHVARRAGSRCVFPSEREPCRVVIKGRSGPLRSRMARFAGLGELRRCVVRIRRFLEVG